jgi:hypothetical protein
MQNSSMWASVSRGGFAAWLSAALLALLLAGCSLARLGFSHAETISYWWLDSYVDFEAEQRPWVRKQLAGLFTWHRKTQLKGYADYLAHLQKRVEAPVTEAQLLEDYEEFKKRMLPIFERALPDMADLALSLTPEQIASIEKKFASNNKDYRKDHLRGDLEQRQRFRYKKVLEQAEEWLGNLNREQEHLVRAASDARPLNNELLMAEREQRQRELLAILRKIQVEKPAREAVIGMFRSHVAAVLARFNNPEYKAFHESYNAATARMVAAIVNNATPAQKAHFIKSVQQWIDDFNEHSL